MSAGKNASKSEESQNPSRSRPAATREVPDTEVRRGPNLYSSSSASFLIHHQHTVSKSLMVAHRKDGPVEQEADRKRRKAEARLCDQEQRRKPPSLRLTAPSRIAGKRLTIVEAASGRVRRTQLGILPLTFQDGDQSRPDEDQTCIE